MPRKIFYFDVTKDGSVRSRFEVPFVFDDEAIQHSKGLAARIRMHAPTEPGLVISVLDQSGKQLHQECVYPKGEVRS